MISALDSSTVMKFAFSTTPLLTTSIVVVPDQDVAYVRLVS